jgi:hypothetical protein
MDFQTIALIVTVALALLGYLITYQQQLQLSRRKERLDLINRRLDEFYGPLFVSTQASRIAFQAYFKNRELLEKKAAEDDSSANPNQNYGPYSSPEWRNWVQTVLMPLTTISEKAILEKAYLIRDQEMPDCLLQFVAHVSTIKRLVGKWEQGDFSETTSLITFPTELNEYATKSYQELKAEQLSLIRRL